MFSVLCSLDCIPEFVRLGRVIVWSGRSEACSCIILSLVSVACQDDWIACRMKNSAKLQLQLFTQTNESSRHSTQYRCHFRRDISDVVGHVYKHCLHYARGLYLLVILTKMAILKRATNACLQNCAWRRF